MSRLYLLIGLSIGLNYGLERKSKNKLIVIFGRPGAGKTTIAQGLAKEIECFLLDLDVCISKEMRNNFNKGIYPSLEERKQFALDACAYVDNELATQLSPNPCVIAFSFVNTDLRDIFRHRFPYAQWILIDTPSQVADLRISNRQNHFYKGNKPSSSSHSHNHDWLFAPVSFPHHILDGTQSLDINIQHLIRIILQDDEQPLL